MIQSCASAAERASRRPREEGTAMRVGVSLTSAQWGICLLGPIVDLAITELGKLLDRHTAQRRPALAPAET